MDSMEEIVEVIGESSGSTVPLTHSLQMQNFFNVKPGQHSEFDPLSLISIYAHRNKGLPIVKGQKPAKIETVKGA